MLLSIVVCANRDNPYFGAALRSLAVSRARSDSVETVLVANGAWKPPLDVVNFFDRVVYSDDAGLGLARNLGVDNATGDWVSFFDTDDLLDPDYLRATVARLRVADRRTVFFNQALMVDGNGDLLPARFRLEKLPYSVAIRLAHPFTGACMVIERSLFQDTGGYCWDGYAEDYDLTIRLACRSPSIKIVRNEDAVYLYRQHQNTMSGNQKEKIRGVRDVQMHHARSGLPSLYAGVLASYLRLMRV